MNAHWAPIFLNPRTSTPPAHDRRGAGFFSRGFVKHPGADRGLERLAYQISYQEAVNAQAFVDLDLDMGMGNGSAAAPFTARILS
jgi:hypothetical protein